MHMQWSVSGSLKQRRYSAWASGVMAPGTAVQFSNRKSMKSLALLPISVSGKGAGWRIRCQWNHAYARAWSM